MIIDTIIYVGVQIIFMCFLGLTKKSYINKMTNRLVKDLMKEEYRNIYKLIYKKKK